MRNKSGQDYFKHHLDLEEKKEKMFNEGINPSWGINTSNISLNLTEIAKDKDIAKHLMLPIVFLSMIN